MGLTSKQRNGLHYVVVVVITIMVAVLEDIFEEMGKVVCDAAVVVFDIV